MWYTAIIHRFAQKFHPCTGQGYFEFSGIRNPSLTASDISIINSIDDNSDPTQIFGTLWAHCRDNILGHMEYILMPQLSKIYLGKVVVNKYYRNMGIAEILFRFLKRMAVEQGYRIVSYEAYHPSTLTIGNRVFGKSSNIKEVETGSKFSYNRALERLNFYLSDPNTEKDQDGMPIGRGYDVTHRIGNDVV